MRSEILNIQYCERYAEFLIEFTMHMIADHLAGF